MEEQNNIKSSSSLNQRQQLLSGIEHPRIKELISTHPSIQTLIQPKKKNATNLANKNSYLTHLQQRKWLCKKGKKYLIDFDESQRRQMKLYFNAMDKTGSGSIGIDQLQGLLISLGLAQNREQVKALIDSVDQDKSGKIEFQQFLSMIQNDEGQNQQIVAFFKKIMKQNSKLGGHTQILFNQTSKKVRSSAAQQLDHFLSINPKGIPFQMLVSSIRRNYMITALNVNKNSESTEQRFKEKQIKGQKVMSALKRMWQRKMMRKIKQQKDKNTAKKPKEKDNSLQQISF